MAKTKVWLDSLQSNFISFGFCAYNLCWFCLPGGQTFRYSLLVHHSHTLLCALCVYIHMKLPYFKTLKVKQYLLVTSRHITPLLHTYAQHTWNILYSTGPSRSRCSESLHPLCRCSSMAARPGLRNHHHHHHYCRCCSWAVHKQQADLSWQHQWWQQTKTGLSISSSTWYSQKS